MCFQHFDANSFAFLQVVWFWTLPTLALLAIKTPWFMRWATSWDCTMSSRGWVRGTPAMTHARLDYSLHTLQGTRQSALAAVSLLEKRFFFLLSVPQFPALISFRRLRHPWKLETCALTLRQCQNPKCAKILELSAIPVVSPHTRTRPITITWVTQVKWWHLNKYMTRHTHIHLMKQWLKRALSAIAALTPQFSMYYLCN